MLYIMLAYLMLFAAFSNAACLRNASFFPFIYANDFCFHALSWFIDTCINSSSRKVQLQKSEDKRTALVAGM